MEWWGWVGYREQASAHYIAGLWAYECILRDRGVIRARTIRTRKYLAAIIFGARGLLVSETFGGWIQIQIFADTSG